MRAPSSAGHCPHCGASQDALNGLGLTLFLTDIDVALLVELFERRLDNLACEACGEPTGVAPTIELVMRKPDALWIVLGTLMQPHRAQVVPTFVESARGLDPQLAPEFLDSLDALRNRVCARLGENLAAIQSLSTAKDRDTLSTLLRNTHARHFAAALIALGCPSAGIGLNLLRQGETSPAVDLVEAVAHFQADAWFNLWLTWAFKPADPANQDFTLDLDRHFVAGVGFKDAPLAALEKLATATRGKSLSFRAEYCLEAVRAAIHQLAGTENANADRWAVLFFTAELDARLGNAQAREAVSPLLVSDERARATIPYRSAWDAIARIAAHAFAKEVLTALGEIATKAGHAQLMTDFLNQGVKHKDAKPSAAKVLKILAAVKQRLSDPDVLVQTVRRVTLPLREAGMIEALEEVADTVIRANRSIAVRGGIEAWLGECLKELRAPQRFLDRVGAHPRDWEQRLTPAAKAALWTERSNALRLVGRFDEALGIVDEILRLAATGRLSPSDQRAARRNRAILLREVGAPDASVAELETLLEQSAGIARIDVLESLQVGYHQLGRDAEVLRCAEEVVALCVGPASGHAHRARANLALALVTLDRYDEATDHLLALDAQLQPDPFVIFPVASAWITMLSNTTGAPTRTLQAIRHVAGVLQTLYREAEARDDVAAVLGALRLLGLLAEQARLEEAEGIWALALSASEHYAQAPGMYELLALARRAYARGDTEAGRSHLSRLPEALGSSGAQALDIAGVSDTVEAAIRASFNQLTKTVLERSTSFQDVRLVAEMRRDVIGRTQRLADKDRSAGERRALQAGLSDTALARLAPRRGRVAVLEWVEVSQHIACMVTTIEHSGAVSARWLQAPEVDLASLKSKLAVRLRDWTPARPGDPFDLPAWEALEAWLLDALGSLLQPDDHVVFIEHEEDAGLPWHVAAGARWSSSYASGWGMLLAISDAAIAPIARCGIALVPRFRESEEVQRALEASATQMQGLAEKLALPIVQRRGASCDGAALRELLGSTDALALLCHGYVSGGDHEVALMVAHNGALPPAHSVAAGSASGRAHRFGWRECRGLARAPRIVYSAACSSGVSHVVGMGERLGIFPALRAAGTLTLIAPRWDVVASVFLPVLDQVCAANIGQGMPIGRAVREASLQAQTAHPRWLSWAMSIEGDWR